VLFFHAMLFLVNLVDKKSGHPFETVQPGSPSIDFVGKVKLAKVTLLGPSLQFCRHGHDQVRMNSST